MKHFQEIIILILSTVSIVISVADFLGKSNKLLKSLNPHIPSMTLFLLSGLTIYLVIERRLKLEHLERIIINGVEHIITSLDGVAVKKFETTAELYRYMSQRVMDAKSHIFDTTWGPPSSKENTEARTEDDREAIETFWNSIVKVSKKKNVQYIEIVVFSDPSRLERVKFLIQRSSYGYNVGCYNISPYIPPKFGFVVIDSEEVILISYGQLFSLPGVPTHISIKHSTIVIFFKKYFEIVWDKAEKVKEGDNIKWNIIEKFEQVLKEKQKNNAGSK